MNSFNEKEKSLTKIMFHSRKQLSKTEKEKRTIFPVEKEKFKKKQYMAPQSSSFGLVYYVDKDKNLTQNKLSSEGTFPIQKISLFNCYSVRIIIILKKIHRGRISRVTFDFFGGRFLASNQLKWQFSSQSVMCCLTRITD